MQLSLFTVLFAGLLVASVLTRLWLASRQVRHVARHSDAVPAPFHGQVSIFSHRRAASYTIDKLRFDLVATAVSTVVLLGWTLLGGLDALNVALREAIAPHYGDLAYQLSLVACFSFIGGLVELPQSLWNVFRIEQRHGFNRMSLRMWMSDQVKEVLVGIALGLPLVALILWLMNAAGAQWWLWAWAVWVGFTLLLMIIFPTVIAPLFNRFKPLQDDTLRARVEGLMSRCGFAARGLFVMDGSRRSAHANAYFTGLGASKRVVFFDTLLHRLNHDEIEAVLAHELGHFKHRHVLKRMLTMFGLSLLGFALLGWLSGQLWFYQGLGVMPNLHQPNDAIALLLFLLVVPVFGFFIAPVMAAFSRRDEYQADAYACTHAQAQDLRGALVKMYKDNSSTLTPDPLYVRFYYSHPPAIERMAAMTPYLPT